MTIVKSPGPSGGMAAISADLPHLLSRGNQIGPSPGPKPFNTGPIGSPPLGGTVNLNASQPLPLYVVSAKTASEADFLATIQPVGWRYLITTHETFALADVKERNNAQASLSSLIRGPMPERLSEAASVAEANYGKVSDVYDARILEIPSIYMIALWLHGDTDVFFPVLEGQTKVGDKVSEDPDFIKRVHALILRKQTNMPPAAASP